MPLVFVYIYIYIYIYISIKKYLLMLLHAKKYC
jgi:hypothetical protein